LCFGGIEEARERLASGDSSSQQIREEPGERYLGCQEDNDKQ